MPCLKALLDLKQTLISARPGICIAKKTKILNLNLIYSGSH